MIGNPVADVFGVERAALVTAGVHLIVNKSHEPVGQLFIRNDHVILRAGSLSGYDYNASIIIRI